MIAGTPAPPYYAVIFTSLRTEGDLGYAEMADRMVQLAQSQEGFLGLESARNELGITISYWQSLEAIRRWKDHADHVVAREKGRSDWYSQFKTRICLVESDYQFFRP